VSKKLPVEDPKLWAKIQPCPQCKDGRRVAVNNTFLENKYYLACYGCGHQSKERSDSFEQAIEVWNREGYEVSK